MVNWKNPGRDAGIFLQVTPDRVHSQFFPKKYVIPTEFRKLEYHLLPGFTPGPTKMSSRKRDFCLQFAKELNEILLKWQFIMKGRRPDIFVGPDVNPGILKFTHN